MLEWPTDMILKEGWGCWVGCGGELWEDCGGVNSRYDSHPSTCEQQGQFTHKGRRGSCREAVRMKWKTEWVSHGLSGTILVSKKGYLVVMKLGWSASSVRFQMCYLKQPKTQRAKEGSFLSFWCQIIPHWWVGGCEIIFYQLFWETSRRALCKIF